MGAALVISGWAVLRPQDLSGRRPYVFAGIFLLLLALSPLLVLTDSLVRPHAKSQYTARSIAGLVIATVIILMWLYTSSFGTRFAALAALARVA